MTLNFTDLAWALNKVYLDDSINYAHRSVKVITLFLSCLSSFIAHVCLCLKKSVVCVCVCVCECIIIRYHWSFNNINGPIKTRRNIQMAFERYVSYPITYKLSDHINIQIRALGQLGNSIFTIWEWYCLVQKHF